METQASRRRKSKAARAGLQFPVGKIARFMKQGRHAPRVGAGAPVYLAAVLEYITEEVLELAGNVTFDSKKSIITPRHIKLAIKNDEELTKIMQNTTIAAAGVSPSINPFLTQRKSKDRVVNKVRNKL